MLTHRRNWTLAFSLATIGLIGCGGGGGDASTGDTPPADAPAAAPAAVANAATLNVAVNFTGAAPTAAAIDMSDEKVCADKHAGGAKDETVVVNGGKLQNVFVYVKDGLSGTHSAPAESVVIDQDGCLYKPRVAGVMIGQRLEFKNSDGILHNIKGKGTANRPFNITQPTAMSSGPNPQPATKEVMLPVQCDVHGWMQSYVGVLDHPYHGVSGADGGTRIANLPPGTYTIEAWHEKYGTLNQSVTVGPNETKDITFNFSGTAAARVPLGKPLVVPHATHAVVASR